VCFPPLSTLISPLAYVFTIAAPSWLLPLFGWFSILLGFTALAGAAGGMEDSPTNPTPLATGPSPSPAAITSSFVPGVSPTIVHVVTTSLGTLKERAYGFSSTFHKCKELEYYTKAWSFVEVRNVTARFVAAPTASSIPLTLVAAWIPADADYLASDGTMKLTFNQLLGAPGATVFSMGGTANLALEREYPCPPDAFSFVIAAPVIASNRPVLVWSILIDESAKPTVNPVLVRITAQVSFSGPRAFPF
jgi:hypothetical protein